MVCCPIPLSHPYLTALESSAADALVAYRLQHPENAARLFSSAWNTANSPTTTPELSDLRASKQETYQEASDIEALRYVGAIKRLLKANEVQVQQAALFEKQKEAIGEISSPRDVSS